MQLGPVAWRHSKFCCFMVEIPMLLGGHKLLYCMCCWWCFARFFFFLGGGCAASFFVFVIWLILLVLLFDLYCLSCLSCHAVLRFLNLFGWLDFAWLVWARAFVCLHFVMFCRAIDFPIGYSKPIAACDFCEIIECRCFFLRPSPRPTSSHSSRCFILRPNSWTVCPSETILALNSKRIVAQVRNHLQNTCSVYASGDLLLALLKDGGKAVQREQKWSCRMFQGAA